MERTPNQGGELQHALYTSYHRTRNKTNSTKKNPTTNKSSAKASSEPYVTARR